MRLLYAYSNIANMGGAGKILIDKINFFAEYCNYDVFLITYSQGKHEFCFPLSPKVKHIDINIPFHSQYKYKFPIRLFIKVRFLSLFKKRIKQQIETIAPDIIIGLTDDDGCPVCTFKSKAKKITESHSAKSTTFNEERKTMAPLRRIFYTISTRWRYYIIQKYSDVIVCLTEGDAKEWDTAKKVVVIPNIIGKGPIKGSECDSHSVLSVGRLSHQKGFNRLIDAWKVVNSKHPKWNLSIIGEGKYKKKLDEQIEQNGLQKTITIYPYTTKITAEYLKSSIFALSSNYEGFGLVLAEAMACGIPCVSFDCPHGPSDIIKDREDGLLVENGNIRQLANAICYLIENEAIRKKYGKKASENIERFYPENVMSKWKLLFKQLCNGE